ncbi:MAG: YebC/PmpR family DNA-binding transcriptional regulator [candidate division FCPU426 bacterium]
MSGHSKWATTKRKKAVIDSKRGKAFTKIIREMMVAAREGGGDPNGNPRLRTAVDKAKAVNMPLDNINRAIKKGTGELEGVAYESITYEGYGPGGVAVVVDTLSDNRNRTAADIRSIFTKGNGNMGEVGSVGWMFKRKGFIVIPRGSLKEDEVLELALDAGAEDMTATDTTFDVITGIEDFEKVKKALTAKNITPSSAELTMIPSSYVKLEGKEAEQMLRLMDALEDYDDVQNVYANFDIPESVMEAME